MSFSRCSANRQQTRSGSLARIAVKEACAARIEEHVGERTLHAGLVTPIMRAVLKRDFEAAAFPDLDAASFAR